MDTAILTELKYRTFDSLLEDVRVDLRGFALSGRIEPQQLIKVALRVSKELGLRINKTKEAVLEIEHKRGRLPDDFYVMNLALLCGEYTVTITLPQGTHITEVVPKYTTFPETVNPCSDPVVDPNCPNKLTPESNGSSPICLNKCGNGFQLIQTVNSETRTYKYMMPIRFTSRRKTDCNCPNVSWMCDDQAYIRDNFVHTSFECGNMYISYEGSLEDEEGNLLVLDHPIVNEFYEYALKDRILENIYFDGDTTVLNSLQLVQAKLKAARANAMTVVNTPNFKEMLNVWEINRKAMYNKFYAMFV